MRRGTTGDAPTARGWLLLPGPVPVDRWWLGFVGPVPRGRAACPTAGQQKRIAAAHGADPSPCVHLGPPFLRKGVG